MAVAHEFAEGGIAVLARHANDTDAHTFFQNRAFFQYAQAVVHHAYWLYCVALLPLALWWRQHKNKRKQLRPGE
jgi:hypothetical protein